MRESHRPSASAVRLVARREFTTRVMTKSFLISTVVTLAFVIGGQVVLAMMQGDDDAVRVATVGASADVTDALARGAEAIGAELDPVEADDEGAARSAVRDEEADLALLVADDGGFTVVAKDDLDGDLAALVDVATRYVALERALGAQDVDRARLAADVAATSVTVDVLDPSDPERGQRTVIAYVAVLALFFTVYLYGLYVAMGVVEEKASRVVEVLLATIKPLELLIGKILGIGAVGFVQILFLGAAAVVTGIVTGLITIGSTAVSVLAFSVLWYVLGYLFFATLYAALGSLVSRQEDVNSATMPLTVLAFAAYFAAQATLGDPGGAFVQVLSWIPPFSATIMPMLVASGEASVVQIVVAVAVMLVAIVAAAVFAARVYERSVLQVGGRQSLRAVLARPR